MQRVAPQDECLAHEAAAQVAAHEEMVNLGLSRLAASPEMVSKFVELGRCAYTEIGDVFAEARDALEACGLTDAPAGEFIAMVTHLIG